MKIVKILVSVVIVAVAAFFTWNYLFGPIAYKRHMHAFADSLQTCEAFSRPIAKQNHAIEKLADGRCSVRMETLGPEEIHCAFTASDLPDLAKGFAGMADVVDMFGGTRLVISTSNPDRLTQLLNSDACESVML